MQSSPVSSQSPLAGYAAFTAATALLFDTDVQGTTAASQALQFFLRYLLTAADFYAALKPFVRKFLFVSVAQLTFHLQHSTLVQLIQLHQTTFSHPSTNTSPSTTTAPLPHFFDRYEAFGVEEPALAPLFATSSPTPPPQPERTRSEPLQRGQATHEGEASGIKSVAGYLSMLKEILDERERIEGGGEMEDEEATPIEAFDARRLHPAQAESYSLSNSQLFGGVLQRDTYLPTTSSDLPPERTMSPRPPVFPTPFASSTSSSSTYSYSGASPGQRISGGLAEMRDPADMRTWLFSTPMAEGDVWEDESLTSFLNGGDWPLITEDQFGGS